MGLFYVCIAQLRGPTMKLNIAFPATGCQKMVEIDAEKKLRPFYDKRISAEVSAESLGDEWKGYMFRITGGNDKQGFPMKQGVLSNGRVRLLLSKGHSCYRPRREGERRRKSVRGCIVDANLSVLSLVIVKKGEGEIPGLTDTTVPRPRGPKRASKIRRLFNLSKEDDVRQYVVRRPIPLKEGSKSKKPKSKAPKIQRLVTPMVLQRRRHLQSMRKARFAKRREEAADYAKLLAQRMKERKEKRRERKQSSLSKSRSESLAAKDAAKLVPASAVAAAKGSMKPTPKQAAKLAASSIAAAKLASAKGGKAASGKVAAKAATGKAAGKMKLSTKAETSKATSAKVKGAAAPKTAKPAAKGAKPAAKKPAAAKPQAKSAAKPKSTQAKKPAKK